MDIKIVLVKKDNTEIFEKMVKAKAKASGIPLTKINTPHITEQVWKQLRGEEADW